MRRRNEEEADSEHVEEDGWSSCLFEASVALPQGCGLVVHHDGRLALDLAASLSNHMQSGPRRVKAALGNEYRSLRKLSGTAAVVLRYCEELDELHLVLSKSASLIGEDVLHLIQGGG